MRTNIFLYILSIAIIASACHPKTYPAGTASININQIIRDAQGNPDLYGKSTEDGLKQPPFNNWYIPQYNAYTPDSNIIAALRPELRNKTIQIFMATWCGDSKREVPRMLKVLNLCGVPPTAIEIINVGRGEHDYKQSPTHEERGKNIHRVPTFIVYQNGKEINRIVELPVQSLEKDLLSILHRGELDGLGKLQLSLQEFNKALFTLKLNIMLFPEDPLTLRSFAKALLRKGDTAASNLYLEKAERYVRQ